MNTNKNARTEDEARKMWCPMVRFDAGDNIVSNRWLGNGRQIHSNPEACRCIASECAMWRWQAHDDDGRYGCCGLAGDT